MNSYNLIPVILIVALFAGCHLGAGDSKPENNPEKIKLITLAPGHFHAALVQKENYAGIDSNVYVYSPKGADLDAYLALVSQYNSRTENPTRWNEIIYTGNDFDQKAFADKRGNVMVLSGNNLRKTEYILKGIEAGLNVLADKPMAINSGDFDNLVKAFRLAGEKGALLYDIMTERSEITNVIQRELIHNKNLFGDFAINSPDDPVVNIESIHYYAKEVSGKPLIRPDWFFDPKQQGEAVADVGTHLIDLVQWQCFPGESIDYKKDIEITRSTIWPTPLNKDQFKTITGEDTYPDFLRLYISDDSVLNAHGNGEVSYLLKGLPVKITVKWNYKAEAGGDAHYESIRGTKSTIEIRQGKEEDFKPVVYIVPGKKSDGDFNANVEEAIKELNTNYPGIIARQQANGEWRVVIPEKYDTGHEAHFADVMNRYLQYIDNQKMPDWEVPNMIAKYFLTTRSMEIARENK